MGYLLLFVFSVRLHWVAVSATISIKQVILPALTLGMVTSPLPMRVLRASLLDEFSRMYVLVAQAKGFSKHYVLVHHVLPNAILPVMTLLALSFSGLLTGSVIIESVFVWPGMGKYLVDSIYARDYPVIQGYALLTTAIVVFVNLLVDHLYTIIDPRIRL
jgi:ABC-type dipeptide/oligopeptide/nickel transport system permease component